MRYLYNLNIVLLINNIEAGLMVNIKKTEKTKAKLLKQSASLSLREIKPQ